MLHNSNADSFERRDFNLVIEKTKGSKQLPDTSYSNFGLRQKIYHHLASHVYEIYNPLVAINETPHLITIRDRLKDSTVKQKLV